MEKSMENGPRFYLSNYSLWWAQPLRVIRIETAPVAQKDAFAMQIAYATPLSYCMSTDPTGGNSFGHDLRPTKRAPGLSQATDRDAAGELWPRRQ